ncbi:MAG: hydantoinase B/oxoprolinase family protein [Actinobacteria bacterium]|nr:hydantoinase B/oxoprolinase family protein [Actinomycetota bacterium]
MSESTVQVDAFTAEVVRSTFRALADEMAVTVLRTAHSEVVRDTMDFSTAIFDGRGRLVSQGLTLALHLGAMPEAIDHLRERFAGDINPGDVFILNDPDQGGMHLPDIFIFRPVFHEERLIAFAGCVAHHVDVGGRRPGSNAPDSTEIFQEGLQIPPLKLYDGGRENSTLLAILERNVRPPSVVLGDLRAQLAACHHAARGIEGLAERHGSEALEVCLDGLLDHGERVSRGLIATLPDGHYDFTDHIDDDGFGSGPIELHVAIEVSGEEMTVDLTGCAPQVASALNSTASFTRAAVYAAVFAVLGAPEELCNEGLYRPLNIITRPGTVVDGVRPAPRAARALTGFRVVDLVLGALQELAPDRTPAAGEGGVTMLSISENASEANAGSVFVEFISGSWGGGAHADGLDGASPLGGNTSNVPVEVLELHHPIRVDRYGFVADTGGPGRRRGGLAVARELTFLGEHGVLQIRSDRRLFPPYGVGGGEAGSASTNVLNPGRPDEEVLPTKFSRQISRGDVVLHVTAGGGGYGPAAERDPAAVEADLREGKIGAAHAASRYGADGAT